MPTYKPVPDPFLGKGPIRAGASDFYEREEVFTNIQNLLRAGQSISLVGERKAGKTSFLNYLLAHLTTPKTFYPFWARLPGHPRKRE